MYPPFCASPKHCRDIGRWECSREADWLGADGLPPWRTDDWKGVLQYVAGASPKELAQLAHAAAYSLDEGIWQGVKTANGGWVDGAPWDDTERAWRAAAEDFLTRYQSGERMLTEGMIQYAGWDLARELAWMRGWCPLAV